MTHRTEKRGSALGHMARDILCLLWTRRGLATTQIADILNAGHEDQKVSKRLDVLGDRGLVVYLRNPKGWCIQNTEAAKAVLARPAREDGWVRLLSDATLEEPCTNTYAQAMAQIAPLAAPGGLHVPTLLSEADMAAQTAAARQAEAARHRSRKLGSPEPTPVEHTPQLTGERARIAHFALPSQGGVVIRAGALDALRLQARRHSPGADPAAYLGLRD